MLRAHQIIYKDDGRDDDGDDEEDYDEKGGDEDGDLVVTKSIT